MRDDEPSGLPGWYGSVVLRLRWVLVLGWAVVAAAVVVLLPPLPSGDDDLDGFAAGNPAVATERRSFELFGFPLVARTALVQHDPDGLSIFAQAEAVLRAAALAQGSYDTPLLAGLPVPNTFGAFPGSAQEGTTVVTYLLTDPRAGFAEQHRAARAFAAEHLDDPDDAFVGVTGSVPARDVQASTIRSSLHRVELVTVLAVAVIVGVTFRSIVAPLVTLLTVGAAVVVTLGVGEYVGHLLGVSVPADLEPLVVALLLGVVTDYCILFLSGLRHELASGASARAAALRATATAGPIVAVAGITVAAGTGALVVAESALFRGAGPALALAVLLGLVVALTLAPALMAVTGRWTLWPAPHATSTPGRERRVRHGLVLRLVTTRRAAAWTAVGCLSLLLLAAVPLGHLRLGLGFVQSLPQDQSVARAAAAAQEGFAPGIVSPTELLLEGPGVGEQRAALDRLGDALSREAGVAGVLAPGDLGLPPELGLFTTEDGAAARFLLVLDSAPLGAQAIGNLDRLQDRLPGLLREAGLAGVTVGLAGDTALSAAVVDRTTDDLLRITVAALSVNLLLLVLFLRALVAPLYLLASSVLALCAALGMTVLVFQDLLGHDGLTFYVPFTAAVLLLSLGSDYNIFAVGHVWQRAVRQPLRQALRGSVPQTTQAITSAGTALAASFGLLALVPLTPFRELAFAMAAGILIDVFVVRSLLVPSLMTLVGPASGWPWTRFARRPSGSSPARRGRTTASTDTPRQEQLR